jgi:IS5 family transposase
VQHAKNLNQSRVRSKVEQAFGAIKRMFGCLKVRYGGIKKNANPVLNWTEQALHRVLYT